jgi:radical SAM protein with 4Fe4S-binding SPASM domain
MEAIPKNYKLHRRILQLMHLRPQEAVRWIRGVFLSSLEKKREEFPTTISIEITNNCNLACSSCPQPLLSGERGYLSMDLFKKIIDQSYRFPSLTNVVFTGFGEPLLHPQLITMSRYVKSKRIPFVRTYTNCVLLDKQKTEELLLKSGFDEITLSLNSPIQEIYERIKKSRHYEPVTANIEHFLKRRKALKTRTPFVNLQLLKLNDVSFNIEEFTKNWMPLLKPGDCISIKDSHSFAGQVSDPGVGRLVDPRERVPCGQLWNYLYISWNGDVSPCCVDPFKRLKIGNVRDSSLKDLWHSCKIMHMREIHLQKKYNRLPLCGNCETWRYFTHHANNPGSVLERFLNVLQ